MAAIVFIVRVVVEASLDKTFNAAYKKVQDKIDVILEQEDEIRKTDPEIGKLNSEIVTRKSNISRLSDELKEIRIVEKIGTNNLVVSLNNEDAFYYYIDDNAKFQSVRHYMLYTDVDGKDMGRVTEPCMIIPLGFGIHTVTAKFIPASNDVTFTLSNIQFSLKDNNNYLSFKKPHYEKKTGFEVDQNMSRSKDTFLTHSRISESDFESYINRL